MAAAALVMLCSLPTMAQLNGSGFYRFRNAEHTKDYICLTNNIFDHVVIVDQASGGFTNLAGDDGKNRALACASKYMQTDIHMVEDANCIDPATIIYAKKRYPKNNSSYEYNLIGQSTSIVDLTTGVVSHPNSFLSPSLTFADIYATIEVYNGTGENTLYTAYIPLKGTLKYIGTSEQSLGNRYFIDADHVFDIAEAKTSQNAKWYIEPVNYFNVQPEVEFGGKFYTTMYVPFAYTLSNNVLNAYAIKSIGGTLETELVATLETELVATNGGTVPAGTPVLLECSSSVTSECQLIPTGEPRTDNETSYTGNILKGAYFCNQDGTIYFDTASGTNKGSFNANNFTAPTNPQKYVLGITASGKLGFVKPDNTVTAMPANKAWLEYTGSAELVLPFEKVLLGDVNNDGDITIADVTALVNIRLGLDNTEPYKYNHEAADVDGQNGITWEDVSVLVNMILKHE